MHMLWQILYTHRVPLGLTTYVYVGKVIHPLLSINLWSSAYRNTLSKAALNSINTRLSAVTDSAYEKVNILYKVSMDLLPDT